MTKEGGPPKRRLARRVETRETEGDQENPTSSPTPPPLQHLPMFLPLPISPDETVVVTMMNMGFERSV